MLSMLLLKGIYLHNNHLFGCTYVYFHAVVCPFPCFCISLSMVCICPFSILCISVFHVIYTCPYTSFVIRAICLSMPFIFFPCVCPLPCYACPLPTVLFVMCVCYVHRHPLLLRLYACRHTSFFMLCMPISMLHMSFTMLYMSSSIRFFNMCMPI